MASSVSHSTDAEKSDRLSDAPSPYGLALDIRHAGSATDQLGVPVILRPLFDGLPAFAIKPSREIADDDPNYGSLEYEPKWRGQCPVRTEYMYHDVLQVVVGEKRQHEIHPRPNPRGSNLPWHRQLQNGVPGEDAEYTNDGANGRVPKQDTPS